MSTSEASRRIPRPSHNFVPEYQQSGIPQVETRTLINSTISGVSGETGNLITNIDNYKFTFDYVTRWVTIYNHVDNEGNKRFTRVYFNETAAKTAYANPAVDLDKHYLLLDGVCNVNRLELKCKEVWLVPNVKDANPEVSIFAGLTNISKDNFPNQEYNNGFTGIQNNPN